MIYAIAASMLALSAAIQSTQTSSAAAKPFMYSEFTVLDTNQDDELTRREYVRSFGSVRELNMAKSPRLGGSLAGTVFGGFIREGFEGDPTLIFQYRDRISQSCWAALDREIASELTHQFNRYDLNQNGRVTSDEYGEANLTIVRFSYERLDRDGDGMLSEMEVRPSQGSGQETPTRHTSNDSQTPEFVEICRPEIIALSGEQPTSVTRPPDQQSFLADLDLNADGVVDFSEHQRMFGPD